MVEYCGYKSDGIRAKVQARGWFNAENIRGTITQKTSVGQMPIQNQSSGSSTERELGNGRDGGHSEKCSLKRGIGDWTARIIRTQKITAYYYTGRGLGGKKRDFSTFEH